VPLDNQLVESHWPLKQCWTVMRLKRKVISQNDLTQAPKPREHAKKLLIGVQEFNQKLAKAGRGGKRKERHQALS
jgi:hypothetical protein